MPDDDDVTELLRRSQFVFEATVEDQGRSTVSDLPADDHTVVVRIGRVLQAPAALSRAAGSSATVQLLDGSDVPPTGTPVVFFTSTVAFGEGIALREVGRSEPLPVSSTLGAVTMAAGAPATAAGARPGRPHPVLEAAERLETERLRAHVEEAAAVVIGRVVALQQVGARHRHEHSRQLWSARIEVEHADKGDLSGRVEVLFPMSLDVRWARVPKPRAGQYALWILHATTGDDAALAPFALLDADDVQPADQLDRLRREEN